MFEFETSCHAKCILSGEHTIARNGYAIIAPIFHFNLQLRYNCSAQLKWRTNNAFEFDELIQQIFGKFTGDIHIISNIPQCAGLGSSAAIAVAIARLMAYIKKISTEEVFLAAKLIEDFFHSKSSGADIAGVMNYNIIHYHSNPIMIQKIDLAYKPILYLSYSNQCSRTKEAILLIRDLRSNNESIADNIDELMKQATNMMLNSLTYKKPILFKEAMIAAGDCFEMWGLNNTEITNHIEFLKSRGAIACKPTGSGGGGYILSLWTEEQTPQNLGLVPIF